jgi:hypothetical protein
MNVWAEPLVKLRLPHILWAALHGCREHDATNETLAT